MAIENSIRAATSLPLDDIKQLLMKEYGLSEIPPLGRATTLHAEGFWCYLLPEDKLGQEIISEAFGFVPTLAVRLRMDHITHRPSAQTLIDITVILLTSLPDDLVVLESGEIGLLLRTGGSIAIHDDKYWKPYFIEALANWGCEYHIAKLPRL